jgi:hypothetical protein
LLGCANNTPSDIISFLKAVKSDRKRFIFQVQESIKGLCQTVPAIPPAEGQRVQPVRELNVQADNRADHLNQVLVLFKPVVFRSWIQQAV